MAENQDRIAVTADVYLSAPTEDDIPAFVRYLNERQIYDNTFEIPYPYTEDHGRDFIRRVRERAAESGQLYHWAIRDEKQGVIGVIALMRPHDPGSEVNEVGFWLATPFWGRGIMTAVVKQFTEVAFERYGLRRLELRIFADNAASCHVAEKCGYRFERMLPGCFQKEDRKIDAKLYAIERQTARKTSDR